GSGERDDLLDRLEREHAEVRAMLTTLARVERWEDLLRACGALAIFWETKGHLTEGRRWLERALAGMGPEVPTQVRARALFSSARLELMQDGPDGITGRLAEALELFRSADDVRGQVLALGHLAITEITLGELERGLERSNESLRLARERGDEWTL